MTILLFHAPASVCPATGAISLAGMDDTCVNPPLIMWEMLLLLRVGTMLRYVPNSLGGGYDLLAQEIIIYIGTKI
jgi:hypothetical protein